MYWLCLRLYSEYNNRGQLIANGFWVWAPYLVARRLGRLQSTWRQVQFSGPNTDRIRLTTASFLRPTHVVFQIQLQRLFRRHSRRTLRHHP